MKKSSLLATLFIKNMAVPVVLFTRWRHVKKIGRLFADLLSFWAARMFFAVFPHHSVGFVA